MAKWLYKQSTGELYPDGELIETGYSGILTNKNNPDRSQVRGMGPIPRGTWKKSAQLFSPPYGGLKILGYSVSGQTRNFGMLFL